MYGYTFHAGSLRHTAPFSYVKTGTLMVPKHATGLVVSVSLSPGHHFTKQVRKKIRLLTGLGVEGDAHLGVTVKHRSRVAKDPAQPNLRQVHLLHQELLDELNAAGFQLTPGSIGENILTKGMDLLRLPRGTRLHVGKTAVVEVTGLRDPCKQLNLYRPGLMTAVLDRDENGNLIRKAGIMGTVYCAGEVSAGDSIVAELPALPHEALERV
jgi:MOSC domain-containing protein YiiM